jgi:hypothetical protein
MGYRRFSGRPRRLALPKWFIEAKRAMAALAVRLKES